MFLERPVSGDVLREHVVRLLVARGRLSRQSPKFLCSVVDDARARNERTCPHCRGRMEYRHKSASPLTGTKQSRAARPVAVCVRLVLQRPSVRLPKVGAVQGITG
jgi:hypothetical protein